MQFPQIDILDRIKVPKTAKFARNWRFFNKNEFKEELLKIDFNPVFNPIISTDESFDLLMKWLPWKNFQKNKLVWNRVPGLLLDFLLPWKIETIFIGCTSMKKTVMKRLATTLCLKIKEIELYRFWELAKSNTLLNFSKKIRPI